MNEDELNQRLQALHHRLQWITDTEARAAWIDGFGAHGEFDNERTKIIAAAEAVLGALQAMGGSVKFAPK